MVTIVLTEEQAQWLHGCLSDLIDLLELDDVPEELREFISDILRQLEPGGA